MPNSTQEQAQRRDTIRQLLLRAPADTQQALVEIWKHIRGLRDPEAYDAWSYRIVVRECMRDAKRGDERALDTEVETDGVNLLIDPMSLQYLVGAEVDYSEGLQGAQFVIRNPNATTTCGCGSSFSV